MHREKSFPFPVPSPGYRISGKGVEVLDSGSRHHPLCGCCNLQLIQRHVAPTHSPPARFLSPLFFPAKSLLLPKLRGKKKHSKTTWSSSFPSIRTAWSSPFTSEPCGPLPFPSEPRGPPLSPIHFIRTAWTSIYLLASEPPGSLSLWLPRLGLNPSTHLPLQPHF